MMKKINTSVCITLMVVAITFASGLSAGQTVEEKEKARCSELIALLDQELKLAKADIVADVGPISHATTLLAGATIGYQFGRFKGCIDKATRGRERIAKLVKNARKKGVKPETEEGD